MAKNDLVEIKSYITDELQNPSAAVNVLTRITKKLRLLIDFPHMGAVLSSIINIETGYRFLVCGKYTAFYRYNDKTIYIARILYGCRDFMKILFYDSSIDDEIED